MNAQCSEQEIIITRTQELLYQGVGLVHTMHFLFHFLVILIVSNDISWFRSSVLSVSPEERPPTPQLSCCSRHPLGSEKQVERSSAALFCKHEQHSKQTTVKCDLSNRMPWLLYVVKNTKLLRSAHLNMVTKLSVTSRLVPG